MYCIFTIFALTAIYAPRQGKFICYALGFFYICPDFEITGNTMDSIHRTGTAAGRGARPENADRL